jgi:hypothetical protein
MVNQFIMRDDNITKETPQDRAKGTKILGL